MNPPTQLALVNQAQALYPADTTDAQLVEMWLHGRPTRTAEEYRADYERFRRFTSTPLQALTLREMQAYASSLSGLSPAGQARRLSSIKSLIKFGHRLGYLQFDVGGIIRPPRVVGSLAQRIAPEEAIKAILAVENTPRNKLMLLVLYASGGRVSEVCGLEWKDVQEGKGGAGQIRFVGKGQKERIVFLPASVYSALVGFRNGAGEDSPVFPSSHSGERLTRTMVWYVVKGAAKKAGFEKVSPHWFRHGHASHALDNGANIALVMATLGHASIATTGKYLHARPKDGSARFLGL